MIIVYLINADNGSRYNNDLSYVVIKSILINVIILMNNDPYPFLLYSKLSL